jgi:putative transposase
LQVARVRRKRRRRTEQPPQQARHPKHVWSYYFVKDHCLAGTPLRILTVMDEFTREGLALEVRRTFPASQVVRGWLHQQQVQTPWLPVAEWL